jgi:hypothetical protein
MKSAVAGYQLPGSQADQCLVMPVLSVMLQTSEAALSTWQ